MNVAVLAVMIGSRLAYERPTLMELGLSGLLHDVGKLRSSVTSSTSLGP